MEKKILVEKVVGFYFATGLLDESVLKKDEIKVVIADCLEREEYVETIINTITYRVKTHKNLDIEKIKEILIELERIRLELEYKNYENV